ncbi:MAG: serine hydrolase, partial [Candidatus Eremiobacterota bacterium]
VYLTNRAAYLISLGMGSEWEGMGARAIAARWLKMSHHERLKAVERILQENRDLTLDEFQAAEDASAARQSGQAYLDDVAVAAAVDNLASPNDMADLLGRLYQGEILDKKWTAYCLDVLARQRFNTRIPRLLPAGTRVYHKTGTIVGVVNDAGIIRLGDGTGLVVVVFVRDVRQGSSDEAGTLIAKVARLAYDAYR